ncbi:uncharacterized protein LOC121859007 [Homarus americanus]|nr:uncharacterized protein LOC121859007 [Homarus americanus]
MPTYVETNKTDAITCYTRRPKDYAATANITAGKQHIRAPSKVKESLVDGIYGFNSEEGFKTTTKDKDKWFVLDMGKEVTFTHVLLIAQRTSTANRTADIEVRVGTSAVMPPEGFTAYSLFGWFPGPAYPNQEIVLTSPQPVSARFISVQKMSGKSPLHLNHVEVY